MNKDMFNLSKIKQSSIRNLICGNIFFFKYDQYLYSVDNSNIVIAGLVYVVSICKQMSSYDLLIISKTYTGIINVLEKEIIFIL